MLYPMIGSIKWNQQTEWKWMSYGTSNISGVALYEFRNVREGLIISAVWRLRYVPAGRRGRGPKYPPSTIPPPPPPPLSPPITHHFTTPSPTQTGPPCRKVLHWSLYIGPRNKKSYNCVESHKEYRTCTRLCPKLQYICSLSSSKINIHYPTNDYDYPPSKIVQ